jgi:N utilization substance protein A
VVNELQGEKIDIIQWLPDPAAFLVKGLAPAEVVKVVMDEEAQKFEVVVPDEMLSLAIGRRGQNVRLASQLTGWEIDILTEEEESERRQEELRQRSELFMEALVIDEMMAQLLATEGFRSVEEVAFVEEEELASLEGFDSDLATALQQRATDYLDARDAEFDQQRVDLGVTDELAALEGLTPGMLVVLGEQGIKELDDFAELATDELVDPGDGLLREFELDDETAAAMIMTARAHWFEDEDQAEAAGEGDDAPAPADGETEDEA